MGLIGKLARKKNDRLRKQDEILEAARELFEKNSIDAVKVQDISKRSGYSVGTIYLYFQSKEDLLCALASRGAFEVDLLVTRYLKSEKALSASEIRKFTEEFARVLIHYGVYFEVLNVMSLQQGEKEVRRVLSRSHELKLLRYTVRSFRTARNYFARRAYPGAQRKISPADAKKISLVYWMLVLGLADVSVGQRKQIVRLLGVKTDHLLDYVGHAFSGEEPPVALQFFNLK